jgi:glyoxalase family protein
MHVVSTVGNRTRLAWGDGLPGAIIDVVGSGLSPQGLSAGGAVHHIAFRVPDHQTQMAWREELVSRGHRVTEILDRNYFTSIYFREPGGVLYEIATDTPGFDVDEPL